MARRRVVERVFTHQVAANDPCEDGMISHVYAESAGMLAGVRLFAVCDGHGGADIAKYASAHLAQTLAETVAEHDDGAASLAELLSRALVDLDDEMLDALTNAPEAVQIKAVQQGACCLTALVTRDAVIVANLGDSRAVAGVCEAGVVLAHDLSVDHNGATDSERRRLYDVFPNQRLFATPYDVTARKFRYFLMEHLQVTRALGDYYLKDRVFAALYNNLTAVLRRQNADASDADNEAGPQADAEDSADLGEEAASLPHRAGDADDSDESDDAALPTPILPLPSLERPYVSRDCDVASLDFAQHDVHFLILATDGFWDSVSSDLAVALVHQYRMAGHTGDVAEYLVRFALQREARTANMSLSEMLAMPTGSRRAFHDDTTVLVVFFASAPSRGKRARSPGSVAGDEDAGDVDGNTADDAAGATTTGPKKPRR